MYRGALFVIVLLYLYQCYHPTKMVAIPSVFNHTTSICSCSNFLHGPETHKNAKTFPIRKRAKDVKNLQKPMPKYRLAFREQDLGMLYKIKPLTDQSQITIFFQIPDYDLDSRYKFAPNDYFTSLIGHEGESMLSVYFLIGFSLIG